MKKLIVLFAGFLLSAALHNLPSAEERQKLWEKADNYRFSVDFLKRYSEKQNKLDDIPPAKLDEDILAKYYSCFGDGCARVFKNKSGGQVIVLATMTDDELNDMYILKSSSIPKNIDPFYIDDICFSKCVKITDKHNFLGNKIRYELWRGGQDLRQA